MMLNYVVGIGGWAFERSEVRIVEDHKTVEVTLFIADNKGTVASHTAFGGSRNPGPDGFKSAVTDGLTKAASYFGLGEEVFCGKITAADLAKYAARKQEIEANTPQSAPPLRGPRKSSKKVPATEKKTTKKTGYKISAEEQGKVQAAVDAAQAIVATKEKQPKKAAKKTTQEPDKMSSANRAKLHHFAGNHFDNGQIEKFLDWLAGMQLSVTGWKTLTNDEAKNLLEVVSNNSRISMAKAAFKKAEEAE